MTTPVSGFTITAAASRNVSFCSTNSEFWFAWSAPGPVTVEVVPPGVVTVRVDALGIVVRCWLVADADCVRPCTNVSLLPSGRSLSVSRRRSFTFFSSVSQKRLRATAFRVSVELLAFVPEEAPPAPVTPPEITCVEMPTVSVTSRDMFT